MKGIRQFEAWRAEEIAKVYLLNSGLVTLFPNYNDKFDFLAISKNTPDKKIAVEVKATKYSKTAIKKIFKETRDQLADASLPAILMYIDYDKENGYFEIVKDDNLHEREIESLQADKLKQKLYELV